MTIPEHADPALRRLEELADAIECSRDTAFFIHREEDDAKAIRHALQRIAALTQALPGALRFMEAHHECDACASENITDIMPQCDDCGEAGYCAKRVLDALRRAARVLSPEEGR